MTPLEVAEKIKAEMQQQRRSGAVFYERGIFTLALRGRPKYDALMTLKANGLLGVYRPSVSVDDLKQDIEWVTRGKN